MVQSMSAHSGLRAESSRGVCCPGGRTLGSLVFVPIQATLGFNEASFPPPRASNAVSIVPWVLGGGNLPDLRVDQRVPAPELSHMFRGFPLTLAVKFGKLPRGG